MAKKNPVSHVEWRTKDPVRLQKFYGAVFNWKFSDAGMDGYIVERLSAAADHPQTVCFPEGDYLKGLAILKR